MVVRMCSARHSEQSPLSNVFATATQPTWFNAMASIIDRLPVPELSLAQAENQQYNVRG